MDDTVSLEICESNTFITKLIGEMKNTFNKTEKKTIPSENESNSKAANEPEIVNTVDEETDTSNSIFIKLENPFNDEANVPEVIVVQEILSPEEIVSENTVSEEVLIKTEEIVQEEESNIKPRIVMHFRKPVSNSVTKLSKEGEKDKTKRTVRNKIQETELKRSARRRKSKDGESVLQSAIARKEKSYNEAAKPQRLTRQLKLTPKILENLNQNQMKEKTRSKSTKISEKQLNDGDANVNVSMNEGVNNFEERNYKKHKIKLEKQTKRTNKRLKSNHSDTKDSDTDQNLVSIAKDIDIEHERNDNKIINIEDRNYRRSQRKSTSRYKEEDISNVEDAEAQEGSVAEEEFMYPAHPECSSVGAELIASKLCLCTKSSHIHSIEANKETFCSAVDSVGEKLVGCNNQVNTQGMVRMSTRVPFGIYCDIHRNRMLRHNCCPSCGIFCTQGAFVECEAKHHYHRNCQIVVGDIQCCPHCGRNTPDYDVTITMYSPRKPIFLAQQRIFVSPAKMSFPQLDYNVKRSESPLIPPGAIEIPTSSNCLDDNCDITAIFDVIKQEDYKSLANILGFKLIPMISTIVNEDNMNLIHFCVRNGRLPALHMLLSAGIEMDILDKEQNTPLMVAILAFKNDIVRYLIKVGANISFKGTDGMTALHLAAECGNLEACELLVEAAIDKREYVNSADDGGWTALVWACEHNHLNIVKYLLKKSADPSLRDLKQNVALHWAAFSGCQENVELLLNYGTDVNVVNAQGDTPLHIAARQGKYNTVTILLVRGANANSLNRVNESPLECAQQYEDCYKLILLNITIQSISMQYNRKIILSNDVSCGKEINPIQCINVIDNEQKPNDFIYVTDYCLTSDINVDYKITNLHSCICEDNCNMSECLCVRNSITNWYDEDGRLAPHFDFIEAPLIFECNDICTCNALTCNNRVVQKSLLQRFQLFKTDKKGWGIKTLNAIIKGTFVCEYIGEIVNDMEADQREDDSYFFGLDSNGESYSIDARKYGNFGRFLNHSCSPNLTPVKVFTKHQDLRFPRIALFANRNIMAEEELCFDYGEKFWTVKSKSFLCDCRSSNCKYSKESTLEIDDTIDHS